MRDEKEPGVIASIQKFLDDIGIKPFTHEDILAELVKKFPDRDPDGMLNTIKTQVPSRLEKEHGYNFRKAEQFIVVPPKKA
jgi:hypothetical protein